MSSRDLAARIGRRARRAGVEITPELAGQLQAYLELLSHWNRRINLTALKLQPASDEALDRLILEPLLAARHVRPADRLVIDLGSGGGSPAIPLRLAAPQLRLVMTEVKVRKSAFLREAARRLGLSEAEVANVRFEELLARPDLHESADLVTVRAVRPDEALWTTVRGLLRPGGRVFWFTSGRETAQSGRFRLFNQIESDSLPSSGMSRLVVAEAI